MSLQSPQRSSNDNPRTLAEKYVAWFHRRSFLAVLAFGLLVRLGLLYTTQDVGLMIIDEQHYHQLALNLRYGHGFALSDTTPTSIRPPLYPFFVAFLWFITGTESVLVIRLAQILLSLLNVYLLYHLGLRLFSRPVALLGAAGFWLYPSLLAFNFLFLTEVLFTCLLTSVALGYVILLQTSRRSVAWGVGCVLGLAALTRSVLWPFPLILCPLTFFATSGSWKVRTKLALCLLLGYVLVITPWSIRNTRLQGVFTVVDTMGGLNLLMGNYAHTPLHRAWDAVSLTGEQAWSYNLPQRPPDGSSWTEGRKEKWAVQQALAYIRTYPLLTLERAAIKFASFWGLERVIIAAWQQGLYRPPSWFVVFGTMLITLVYPLVVLLASLGLFFALPENRRAHLFLALVILFICGVHTVIFGHERYRLPLMPFFLVYAASASRQQSWQRLREGMRTAIAPLTVCVLLLVIWGRELLVVETERIWALLKIFFD